MRHWEPSYHIHLLCIVIHTHCILHSPSFNILTFYGSASKGNHPFCGILNGLGGRAAKSVRLLFHP